VPRGCARPVWQSRLHFSRLRSPPARPGQLRRVAGGECSAWITELTEASASPPGSQRVATPIRSSRSRILWLAWRDRASARSSCMMPLLPSSRTRNSLTPPCFHSDTMRAAPASAVFQPALDQPTAGRSNHFTHAAIWLSQRGDSNNLDTAYQGSTFLCTSNTAAGTFNVWPSWI